MSPRVHRNRRGRPPRSRSPGVSRERIVEASLRIVDADGLDGLSMRKLGAELGVEAMAVYYYLPGKAALYDALVEAVLSEIRLPDDFAVQPVKEALRVAAYAYRDVLLAHPNALPVLSARPLVTPGSLLFIEKVLARLLAEDMGPRMAMDAVNLTGNFILGSVQFWTAHRSDSEIHRHSPLVPQPEQLFPSLLRVLAASGQDYSPERTFERGLDILIEGLLRG